MLADGTETSVLGLRMQIKDVHFNKGKMYLTCTASVGKLKHDCIASQNITNSDSIDLYPKQRYLESRSPASNSSN